MRIIHNFEYLNILKNINFALVKFNGIISRNRGYRQCGGSFSCHEEPVCILVKQDSRNFKLVRKYRATSLVRNTLR